MNRLLSLTCASLMCVGGLASAWLTPTEHAALRNHAQLERMVPAVIGAWHADPDASPPVESPELRDRLARVYAQVLARSYVDAGGRRVMLSIAYSADQRENAGRQTHRPELCYPAQGFAISQRRLGTLPLSGHTLPVIRMVATQGERIEPITYWMTLDGLPENSMFQMKLDQIRGGLLHNVIQDGMVIRVSSIDGDPAHAWQVETAFLNDLFSAAAPDARRAFFGIRA